jgi:formyltetrahydrofolate deformylase
MSQRQILAVVSVTGQDQKGVVARVSTFLAENGVNIEDIEQKVVQGLFIMNMLTDLSELAIDLDDLMAGLQKLGETLRMEIKVRLLGKRRERRVVFMVTRETHCLDRLLADVQAGELDAEVVAILSNREDLRPRAEAAGIPFHAFTETDRDARDQAMVAKLAELRPDLVVLARYMQILTPAFVEAWRHRIINIHPSLLPYHPGANAYKQAFDMGRRVAGCTAHFVTEDLDEGPIILQDVFHINVGEDTLEEVKAKGQALEANVLSKAVQLFLNDELLVKENKVVYRPGLNFFRKHHAV